MLVEIRAKLVPVMGGRLSRADMLLKPLALVHNAVSACGDGHKVRGPGAAACHPLQFLSWPPGQSHVSDSIWS